MPLSPHAPTKVCSANKSVQVIQRRLTEARTLLRIASRRQKDCADKLSVDASFAADDWVLLSSKYLHFKVGSSKLLPRWIGPFQIADRVVKVAYELVLPRRWKVQDVFHVSCLEDYRRDGTIQPPPPAELLDTEDEHEVEAVLDHKNETNHKGVPFWSYLVAWCGAPDRPSWEPARNLANAAGKVQSYWDHVSGKSSTMPARIPAPLALPMVLDMPMAEQLLIASRLVPLVGVVDGGCLLLIFPSTHPPMTCHSS